jgi:hypothetical protein
MSSTVTSRPEPSEPDWTTAALDRIDSAVSAVRDSTTTRLVVAARAVVYGLIAVLLGGAALLLFVMALVRILDVYLANLHILGLDTHPGRSTWLADAILGGIFTAAGLFLIRKASAEGEE